MPRNIPGQAGQALEGRGRRNTHMQLVQSTPCRAGGNEHTPGPAGRAPEGAGRHRAGAARAGGPASP